MNEAEPAPVDPSQLTPGPIRHESLPTELLDRIKAVFDVIGQHFDMTLEQFETGFMRDLHPAREVALWCNIALAWLAYHKAYLNDERQSDEDERKLLGALIGISTGINDASQLNVPTEVGQRLLQCYENLRKE